MTGNLIPKPASLTVVYNALNSLTDFDDKYHMKGNYGDDISFDVDGVFVVKLFDNGEKK